jgi:hypothetical protein
MKNKKAELKKIEVQCSLRVNRVNGYILESKPLMMDVHFIRVITDEWDETYEDAKYMVLWGKDKPNLTLLNIFNSLDKVISSFLYHASESMYEDITPWISYYRKRFESTHDRYKHFYNFEFTADEFADIDFSMHGYPLEKFMEAKFEEAFEYFYNEAKEFHGK